jgi:hypothetical protein
MTNRNNVAELYTPIYDSFMLETFKEDTQKHNVLFESIDDSTKEYKWDGLSALGKWVDANEGEGGGYEDPVLDYPKTLTQAKYWKKFQVSFEAVDQDEYALLKKEQDAKAMGRGARAKVEVDTSTILSGGFTTTGPDGQYRFDTDHPKNREETGTTYDNLLSGAFSHDNLEAAETQIAKNLMDLKGIPIESPEDPIIVYPPALRGAVQRVLDERATDQPDTALRNMNRFSGRYRMCEWKYLGANFSGGSDTAWFIIFPELGFLKIVWSAKPHFTSWVDEDLEYYKFKGRMLYDCGDVNWRFGFASTGV